MSKKWSIRTVNTKKGKYAIVTGKAYPQVKAGANATSTVRAPLDNREAFYNDPAVILSDADMDKFDGAENVPLCIEHNRNHVVGHVHHSWIQEQDGKRCLKIIGRIPIESREGKKVFEDIQAGKYTGFSVGYGTDLETNGNGTHRLNEKIFREISLVEQPFFEGCNLTLSVMASKKGNLGNNFTKLL
ncbi:MAG: HK97 family phage prohead protease [Nitrosomonas sp.]|nr:HK97 family phage prohead protease [Nitrosomonas sp.]